MKITELMHLLGEALDEHGNVEVVLEQPGDPTNEDDWHVMGISRMAIVTPVDNSPEIDRGITMKSVVLFSE